MDKNGSYHFKSFYCSSHSHYVTPAIIAQCQFFELEDAAAAAEVNRNNTTFETGYLLIEEGAAGSPTSAQLTKITPNRTFSSSSSQSIFSCLLEIT